MAARRALDAGVAAGVGLWAAFFLRPLWSAPAAVVLALATASALDWRRPRVCLALASSANLVAAVAWVGPMGDGNQWNVAMAVAVGVSLGAFEQARFAIGGVLLLGITVSLSETHMAPGPLIVVDLAWPALFIGGVVILARSLARAQHRAFAERERVSALAARSPEEAARLAVARERDRLLADVHAVLGQAVSSMLTHADSAGDTISLEAATKHLRNVQRSGRVAVTELRLLLGQLRASPIPVDHPPGPEAGVKRCSRCWTDHWHWGLTTGVVVLAVLEVSIWRNDFDPPRPEPTVTSAVVTAAAATTIALRRSHPLLGAASLGAILAVCGLLGAPVIAFGFAVLSAILILTWSAMARPGIRPILAVVVLVGGTILYLTPQALNLPFFLGTTAGTAVVSAVTARHRGRADISAADAAGLDRDQRAASAEAVRAQRLAVARDLHDVVSHAVVVMTLQAGAAETLLPTDPGAARAALHRLRAVGSATLTELDDLFAALRAMDDTDRGDPISHDIPALVARMRAGGLTVDLQAPPHPPSGPLVYRVVQESLTNSLRHAPQATVHVTITESEHGTTVEVVDDGPGPTSPAATRGYGLVGITERVEHAGGRVETGPTLNGRGFRVLARIPTSRAQVST
jgi:signal transduction histidine kinase